MQSEEITLDVGGVTLAAKRWRNGPLPVIALHGWLDNAASFDVIAPLLEGADVVALDLAGHGHSYHRARQASYNIWEDLPDILRAADQLGWPAFNLIGHSRGAMIAALLTVTLPERVISTAFLDGFRPQAVPVTDTFKQLSQSLREHLAPEKPRTLYETQERALQVRVRVSKMRVDSARSIVERGLRQVEGGYAWRADPRLQLASAVKLSDEQLNLMQQLLAQRPCQLWAAEGGLGAWLRQHSPFEQLPFPAQMLSGSHHFHMEEQAVALAGDVLTFLRAHNP